MDDEAAEALRSARNTLIARGWHRGHSSAPAVSVPLGAQERTGPVSMITALAYAPGPLYRRAYEALRLATGSASLNVWEGQPGRSLADVLRAYEVAINLTAAPP